MPVLSEVLKANETYAANFGAKSQLAMPPARRFAILTCMDARLDPAKYAGLSEGDAHVIRNAGGRASDDAIRSLVVSYKLLGTREWFVVHHSDCGMLTFDDAIMSGLLEQSLEGATVDEKGWHDHGHGPGSVHGHYVKWLAFKDVAASVVMDVKCIRSHPLVPGHIPVYGYYYDVKTDVWSRCRKQWPPARPKPDLLRQFRLAAIQTKSGVIDGLRSIQPGTGRFFERRNSGLKSFDW